MALNPGERLANLRAAVAVAEAALCDLLEKSRIPGGKVIMSPAVEDELATVQATLLRALEEDATA